MSLIARLIEAGAPADVIEEVALLVAEKRSLDARRENDRQRKQAERDRKKDQPGCHVTSQDVTGQVEPKPEQKNPPQTPHKKHIPPVTPKGVTAPQGTDDRKRGKRIDPNWQPPPIGDLPPKARSLAEQWKGDAYATEAEAFLNFWLSETGVKSRKLDWSATWANRVVQISPQVMRNQRYAANDSGGSYLASLKARSPP